MVLKRIKPALWPIVVILGILVLAIAINLRDQALDPAIESYGAETAPAIAEPENGFYAVLGFGRPSYADPYDAGKFEVEKYEAVLKHDPYVFTPKPIDISGVKDLMEMATAINNLVCDRSEFHCRRQRTQSTELLHGLLVQHKNLLARYEGLHRYPQFHDVRFAHPNAPFDHLAPLRLAHQLYLAKVVLAARHSDLPGASRHAEIGQALNLLERDTRFWRRLLAGADNLIVKMTAERELTKNVYLLSELTARYRVGPATMSKALTMLAPLTEAELDLRRARQREFRVVRYLSEAMAQDDKFRREFARAYHLDVYASGWVQPLFALFYLPRATVNAAYREFQKLDSIIQLPAPEFARRLPAGGWAAEPRPSLWRWDIIYNPIGKQLISDGFADFRAYRARLFNLDGLMRLVTLQLRAKQANVEREKMQEFLRRAGPTLTNPYTGEPMQYDAKRRSLYFMGYDATLTPTQRIEVWL